MPSTNDLLTAISQFSAPLKKKNKTDYTAVNNIVNAVRNYQTNEAQKVANIDFSKLAFENVNPSSIGTQVPLPSVVVPKLKPVISTAPKSPLTFSIHYSNNPFQNASTGLFNLGKALPSFFKSFGNDQKAKQSWQNYLNANNAATQQRYNNSAKTALGAASLNIAKGAGGQLAANATSALSKKLKLSDGKNYASQFSNLNAQANKLHPVASTIGNMVGASIPGGVLDLGVGAAAAPLLSKLGTSVGAKILGNASTAALSNGLFSGASAKLNGESNSQALKEAGQQAIFGAALGGAGSALANAGEIKNALKSGISLAKPKAGQLAAVNADRIALANRLESNARGFLPKSGTGDFPRTTPNSLEALRDVSVPGKLQFHTNTDAPESSLAGIKTATKRGETSAPTLALPAHNSILYASSNGRVAKTLRDASLDLTHSEPQISLIKESDIPAVVSKNTQSVLDDMISTTGLKKSEIPNAKSKIVDTAVKYSEGKASNSDIDNLYKTLYSNPKQISEPLDESVQEAQKYLRGTKIFKGNDLTSQNDFTDSISKGQKSFFGKGLYLTNSRDALAADQIYSELNNRFPSLFPESITNPQDQAQRMLEVMSIRPDTIDAVSSDPYHRQNFDDNFNRILDEVNTAHQNNYTVSNMEDEAARASEIQPDYSLASGKKYVLQSNRENTITPAGRLNNTASLAKPVAGRANVLNPDFIGKSAAEINAAKVSPRLLDGKAPTIMTAEKEAPVTKGELYGQTAKQGTPVMEAAETGKREAAAAGATRKTDATGNIGAMNKTLRQQMIEKYGLMEHGYTPGQTRVANLPNALNDTTKIRRFVGNAIEAPSISDEAAKRLDDAAVSGQFNHAVVTDKKSLAHADKIISDKGIDGAARQWDALSSSGNEITKNDVALAQRLIAEAGRRGDTDEVQRLVADVASHATTWGQNTQALSMLKKLTPEGNLYFVQKEIDKFNADLVDRLGEKAPKITLDKADAQAIMNAKTPAEISDARSAAFEHVAQKAPSDWATKLNAWRYFFMLANPKTHIRNIIGNAMFQPIRKFSDIVSAGMEKTLKVGERAHAVLNPLSKSDKAIMDFAKADYAKMGDVLGGSKFDDLQSAIRENQPVFKSKLLEGARKLNSTLLEKEDQFFSGAAYKDYLAQYLKSNHYTPEFMSSGTKEAAEALEKGRNFAMLQAKRATFNEANSLATALNRMERNLSKKGVSGKIGIAFIEGTLPFKRTPMNIIKRGIEYSPANLIRGVGETLTKVRKGDMDAATAIQHMSEGITGTGLLALGAYLGANGIINGPTTATGKTLAYGQMNGDQAYSLNIAGHTYTIDWMSPAIMPVMMGAEIFKDNLPKTWTQQGAGNAIQSTFTKVVNAVSGISDPVFNLTMLQGVNNLFSNSSAGNALGTAMSNSILNLPSQFVPTIGGQIARTLQPNRKSTYTGNKLLNASGINKLIAKVPILANTLPDYRNLWGQKESNGNVGQRILSNFVSPGYVGTRLNTPVDAEVQRLYKSTDATALPAQAAADSVSGYTMSPEEQQQFQKVMGQQSYKLLGQLFDDPTYKSLPDYATGSYNDKIGMVSKIYTDAKNAAKIDFYKRRGIPIPESLTKITKVTKSKKYNPGKSLYQQIASWGK